MSSGSRFRDREDAARALLPALGALRGTHPLVLAIPRGAVPMGRVLADALGGELDVVLVRKLGSPSNAELAIGAIDEHGRILPRPTGGGDPPGGPWVDEEAQRQLAALRDRRVRYGRPVPEVAGRVVVVVDDGVATGATLRSALHSVRAGAPARLVAAVGVAPPTTAAALRPLVDDLVVGHVAPGMFAVGQYFDDFGQVTDDEVVALLGAAASA